MKKVIALFTTLLLMGWSVNVLAFSCSVDGATIESTPGTEHSARVEIDNQDNETLNNPYGFSVKGHVRCKNDLPDTRVDKVSLYSAELKGGLSKLHATITYYGYEEDLPVHQELGNAQSFTAPQDWDVQFKISPVFPNKPVGDLTFVKAGEEFAILKLHQTGCNIGTGEWPNCGDPADVILTWHLYFKKNMIVKGCNISKEASVELGKYDMNSGESFPTKDISLTLSCANYVNIAYTLSGTTTEDPSVFANTADSPRANGIGVQIMADGKTVRNNQKVELGEVRGEKNLNLSATYARTGGELTVGDVQSIIKLTFQYE